MFAPAMYKTSNAEENNTVSRILNTGAQIINKAAPLPCRSILQFQAERDKDLCLERWNILLKLDESKRPVVLLLITITMVCFSFARGQN